MRLDDILINMLYYDISSAWHLTQILDRGVRKLCLSDEITPEMKKAWRKDLGFSGQTIYTLGQAHDAYMKLRRCLTSLNDQLDLRVMGGGFDAGVANTNDLIAFKYLYLDKADGDRQAVADMHQLLLDYVKPDEYALTNYEHFRGRSRSILKEI